MSMETVRQALAATVVVIPIIVVTGAAILLTLGGAVGCTRRLSSALTNGSEPRPTEAPGKTRLA